MEVDYKLQVQVHIKWEPSPGLFTRYRMQALESDWLCLPAFDCLRLWLHGRGVVWSVMSMDAVGLCL